MRQYRGAESRMLEKYLQHSAFCFFVLPHEPTFLDDASNDNFETQSKL
jgi:hypothetical protein